MSRKKKILLFFLLSLILFTGAGLYNGTQTTFYTIETEKLPPNFTPLNICLISDTHLMDFADNLPEIIFAVEKQSPDLIVLTGDIYDIKAKVYGESVFVSDLVKIAPVVSISGNHERWHKNYKYLITEYGDKGVVNVENSKFTLDINGNKIDFFGITDPGDIEVKAQRTILEKIEKLDKQYTIDKSSLNIMLFHKANYADFFADSPFDIMLSGHMHGGQVRLPFIGGLVSQYGEFFPKYTSGVNIIKNVTLIVSRGIGNTKTIPRFFNRPEIVMIEIKAKI